MEDAVRLYNYGYHQLVKLAERCFLTSSSGSLKVLQYSADIKAEGKVGKDG